MKEFKTALIIDDDKDLCMLVKSMLVNHITDVHCVHSLEEGKKKVAELMPDLILLDNNLPDGQGLHFIPVIKSVSPASEIILVSAFDNLNNQALAAGANAFLEKRKPVFKGK